MKLAELLGEKKPKELPGLMNELADKLKGKDGYTPVKNIDYFDGEPGKPGPTGPPGPPGKSIKGEDGYTPIKGIDYFDGKDGSPDSPQQIVKKINTLEEVLNPEVIIGWKKIWEDHTKVVDEKFKKISNFLPRKGFLDQRWHGGGASQRFNGSRIYRENLQILGDGVENVIEFDAINFETSAGDYDPLTFKWTPKLAGYWKIQINVNCVQSVPSIYSETFVRIYKNTGVVSFARTEQGKTTSMDTINTHTIELMDGVSDYIIFTIEPPVLLTGSYLEGGSSTTFATFNYLGPA